MNRSRIIYLLLTLATIIIGLLARRYAAYLPDMVNLGLGDALWAVMMYWIYFSTLYHQKTSYYKHKHLFCC